MASAARKKDVLNRGHRIARKAETQKITCVCPDGNDWKFGLMLKGETSSWKWLCVGRARPMRNLRMLTKIPVPMSARKRWAAQRLTLRAVLLSDSERRTLS